MLNYPYAKLLANYNKLKTKPHTYAHKILLAHKGMNGYKPQRVNFQDASGQTALLQLLSTNTDIKIPASVHCDHLIPANTNLSISETISKSISENQEVYDFLKQACLKLGITFHPPGDGIIHQVVLENYAAPGILMLGTDSHTPNAGGLGSLAIGVGGLDAVEALCGLEWDLGPQKVIGVHLSGKLKEWVSPKDIVLHLLGQLTVKGGTNHIIEYFGEGIQGLSCTGMATICNLGAELGATSSLFPYTPQMANYLNATQRGHLLNEINANSSYFTADAPVYDNPGQFYDKVIEIDLNTLEPHLNGPYTPDHAMTLSQVKEYVKINKLDSKISSCLIGSCTNSSYEDMTKSTEIIKQMASHHKSLKCDLLVTPGSQMIKSTMVRDGLISTMESNGAIILSNSCGPCIGQWERDVNTENIIITSYNRNFRGRNDGNQNTMNFIGSPELVTAMAYAGDLTFDPRHDMIDGVKIKAPIGKVLPTRGYLANVAKSIELKPDPSIIVKIDPNSQRLQEIAPFEPFYGQEMDLRILLKIKGKCTTDAISAAGKWLKYKGHLQNISENTLIGATNADLNQMNVAMHHETLTIKSIPNLAQEYKSNHIPWMLITDDNYGEGSARESAAMQVRYLNCKLILAKSFARIHETNLKKQGVLPLTFLDKQDYDLITNAHLWKVETNGLKALKPNSPIILRFKRDNQEVLVKCKHSMTDLHLKWFKAGSALNTINKH
eukprot:NODE_660_length_4952_cov_0.391304.p1 type:complete len:723 gc:universal NODE_660_length_4952_cov_0.391304:3292-1124(-)